VFQLLLAIAVAAILCRLVSEWSKPRREHLLGIADNHARMAANYRENGNLWVAAWHERMSREFEWAAERFWVIPPRSRPFPPTGWTPPP